MTRRGRVHVVEYLLLALSRSRLMHVHLVPILRVHPHDQILEIANIHIVPSPRTGDAIVEGSHPGSGQRSTALQKPLRPSYVASLDEDVGGVEGGRVQHADVAGVEQVGEEGDEAGLV